MKDLINGKRIKTARRPYKPTTTASRWRGEEGDGRRWKKSSKGVNMKLNIMVDMGHKFQVLSHLCVRGRESVREFRERQLYL